MNLIKTSSRPHCLQTIPLPSECPAITIIWGGGILSNNSFRHVLLSLPAVTPFMPPPRCSFPPFTLFSPSLCRPLTCTLPLSHLFILLLHSSSSSTSFCSLPPFSYHSLHVPSPMFFSPIHSILYFRNVLSLAPSLSLLSSFFYPTYPRLSVLFSLSILLSLHSCPLPHVLFSHSLYHLLP